tara:strand:+ start:103017 stop:104069 length:1053 start_codon:yes stop_codon:yes gene_type:complete
MEALSLRDIYNRPVNIFSDGFVEKLLAMPYNQRSVYFANIFKNLEVISVNQEHGIPRIGKSDYANPKGWVNIDNYPPSDDTLSFEDYMSLVPDFVDPYEDNIIEHDGVLVVRDDMLPGNLGSKCRFAEALMQQTKEKYIVYAMVREGQALKVLASVAKKYNKIVIGVACLYKTIPTSHIEAMQHGAVMMYYQTGGMAGARKRCRAFINDQLQGQGVYIPAGVKHPFITAGFAKSVRRIYDQYKPDIIFSVASTMTMNHGIQIGAPKECEVVAIQVAGNSSTKKWPGRAKCIIHDQPFSQPCPKEDLPPFNSIKSYDAKGWKYALEYKKANPDKIVMFWNVAGKHELLEKL